MMAGKKIKRPKEIIRLRGRLRGQGRKVVFTNGCFDLIHGGHIKLFRKAKRLGDVLVVAVNTDASMRGIKGRGRPIFPLRERLEVLEAVADIDYITWFPEPTPRRLIAAVLPDVLVKGGDWGPDEIVGREEVEAAGGRVVIVPYVRGHSSSSIISKIVRNYS
jgi:D-beta-D-heptose 7-phosphate kinase/D-beta-D-heptose 1-phosphate adenosyltransferase